MNDYRAKRGLLDHNSSFSSFWMDKDTFVPVGLSARTAKARELEKAVKLAQYRRAIVNFVKILTKKDIPVYWHGQQSMTNGKAITLTTDLDAKNFDTMVGLALHEASHVLLSDFNILKALQGSLKRTKETEYVFTPRFEALSDRRNLQQKALVDLGITFHAANTFLHGIHNWVEDRRIDHYVFSTSPGYKAYYHTLYDKYWNTPQIEKGLKSAAYRDTTSLDAWECQIMNMISPHFRASVMPGLQQIVDAVDLSNPDRWKNDLDALETALDVVDIVIANWAKPKPAAQPKQPKATPPPPPPFAGGDDDQEDDLMPPMPRDEETEEQEEEEEVEQDDTDTDPEAAAAARKALEAQRRFLQGKVHKETASKSMAKKLAGVGSLSLQMQGTEISNCPVAIMDYTSVRVLNYTKHQDSLLALGNNWEQDDVRNGLRNEIKAAQAYVHTNDFNFAEFDVARKDAAILAGLQLGAVLGKKMVRHSEQRATITNRLHSGKIDQRRIAHAGYGIESIFHQTRVDQCKPAHIHISLDASGSMSGQAWMRTATMAVAIAKAATIAQSVSCTIDIRMCMDGAPRSIVIYKSKINKLHHLTQLLRFIQPQDSTPEALCFDAMIKAKVIVPATAAMDSYFINISDGEPGCDGYSGDAAVQHTRKQVGVLDAMGVKVLSYYLGYSAASGKVPSTFALMYGPTAKLVDTTSVVQIASTINALLLSSKA